MATLVREVISFMWLYIIYRSLLLRVCVKKKSFMYYIISFSIEHVYGRGILLH